MISKYASIRVNCDHPTCKEEPITVYIQRQKDGFSHGWSVQQVGQDLQKGGWFSQPNKPIYCPIHIDQMISIYKEYLDKQKQKQKEKEQQKEEVVDPWGWLPLIQ
jgi:hypothetical protein